MSIDTQTLLMEELLKRLPPEWRLAPIHRKGHHNSEGKTPLDASRHEDFDADKVLEKLETRSRYSAVGVWLGARSQGLICVDVDHRDGEDYIRQKYGEGALPRTFSVKSPRLGHIKHFYRVPAIYWDSGKGQGLEPNDRMFEILWSGRQAIILGDHPDGGEYEWVTPVEDLAAPPQWLLDTVFNNTVFFKLPQKVLATTFNEEEAATVVRRALSLIPNPNRNELGEVLYEEWYRILCSVHDALPNERGLELFEEWAAQSDKYVPGYAAERSWPYLSKDKGDKAYRTFGHLIQELRDQGKDPVPPELQHKVVLENGGEVPALNLGHDQLMQEMQNIYLQPNPSRLLFDLATLSKATRFPIATLNTMYERHLRYLAGSRVLPAKEVVKRYDPEKTLSLIPDLLIQGSVVLLHGDSGSGKSYLAYNIAKAVAEGNTFKGYKARKGVVLIFQSDENPIATSQRLQYMGLDEQDSIIFVQGWTFDQTLTLRTLLEKYRPILCIFDSLSSSNLASGVSENDPAYAAPLNVLTNDIVPSYGTTALILHHNNRQGEFRGTSAIKAAVDEMWEIRRPSANDTTLSAVSTAIIEITKSRMDLWGTWVATYDPDTKVYHSGSWDRYTPPESEDTLETQPQTMGERVRMWFESRNDDEFYSFQDLQRTYTFADAAYTTIKSAVINLVNRGVLEKLAINSRVVRYRAVRRQGLKVEEDAAPSTAPAESPSQPLQPAPPPASEPEVPRPRIFGGAALVDDDDEN